MLILLSFVHFFLFSSSPPSGCFYLNLPFVRAVVVNPPLRGGKAFRSFYSTNGLFQFLNQHYKPECPGTKVAVHNANSSNELYPFSLIVLLSFLFIIIILFKYF
jgi:hypothetical protein